MVDRLETRAYVAPLVSTTTLLFALTISSSVLGQEQPTDAEPTAEPETDRDRALDLFLQAESAYESGDIEHAVDLLVEARTLHDEPVLLFNLARAYETLGRIDEALAAYRQFLRDQPEAPDRGAIETRIAALEAQIRERATLERERASAEARAREAGAQGPSALPWVIAGTGVAALGAGAVFGALSTGARDDAVANPVHARAVETFQRGEDFALVANVLFVAGGAIGIAGLVWGLVDIATQDAGEASGTSVALAIGPALVELHGTF